MNRHVTPKTGSMIVIIGRGRNEISATPQPEQPPQAASNRVDNEQILLQTASFSISNRCSFQRPGLDLKYTICRRNFLQPFLTRLRRGRSLQKALLFPSRRLSFFSPYIAYSWLRHKNLGSQETHGSHHDFPVIYPIAD